MTFDPLAHVRGSKEPATPTRVLVADDFGAMLCRLRDYVEGLGNLSVVAMVNNGHEAWDSILKLKPDVALLDLQMPGLTGLEVAGRVSAAGLPTKVVIVSVHDSEEVRSCCVAAGASGFVAKQCLTTELPGVLTRVAKWTPGSSGIHPR